MNSAKKNTTITASDFLNGCKKLEIAFNYKMTEPQFQLYYEKLGHAYTKESFDMAVERIIEQEARFPAICVLWSMRGVSGGYPSWY